MKSKLSRSQIFDRKLNIVVSGLPGRGNDVVDLVSIINKNFDTIQQPLVASQFVSTIRLGRLTSNSSPRLLCVKLDSAATRRSIFLLRTRANISNSEPRLYFRPDLTKAQQQFDRKLRLEWAQAGKDYSKFTEIELFLEMKMNPGQHNHPIL